MKLSPQKITVLETVAVTRAPVAISVGNPRTWWSLCAAGLLRHVPVRTSKGIVRSDGFALTAAGRRALRRELYRQQTAGALVAALLPLLSACSSPSITASDVENARNACHLELDALQACAVDGGTCPADRTRALERGAYCANLHILHAHRADEPDAGIECQP